MRWMFWACWVCGACSSEKALTDTSAELRDSSPPPSACGAVIDGWEINIQGIVLLRGEPATEALVTVRENVWVPGTVNGNANVDAVGGFTLLAQDMVSVEDCWGIMLDYSLDVSLGDMELSRNINAPILGAWTRGESVVDLTAFPFELDDTWMPSSDTGLP